MDNKVIGVASDHAGYEMKEVIIGYLMACGYPVKDYGCHSSASVDYPDYAHPLAEGIEKGDCCMGIALCGSANGISMTLNKHQDIRAAICWKPELAVLARQHNDANVCSLPARFIDNKTACDIIDSFLGTAFEGGRHQIRIDKIRIKNNK